MSSDLNMYNQTHSLSLPSFRLSSRSATPPSILRCPHPRLAPQIEVHSAQRSHPHPTSPAMILRVSNRSTIGARPSTHLRDHIAVPSETRCGWCAVWSISLLVYSSDMPMPQTDEDAIHSKRRVSGQGALKPPTTDDERELELA